jgi:hypothetical protein
MGVKTQTVKVSELPRSVSVGMTTVACLLVAAALWLLVNRSGINWR